jgi:hypothetical protein
MASGDGVCAGEAQIENRSMLAMINRHLDMGSSDDRSRDDTRKLSFPTQQQEASTSREVDAAFATFVRKRGEEANLLPEILRGWFSAMKLDFLGVESELD